MLGQMIRVGMGLVLSQQGIDRRHLLYNKKGHKQIQIKRVASTSHKVDWDRVNLASDKISRLYSNYDTLLGLEFKDHKLYSTILHLIRYYNSGNTSKIAQNRAAYFQTEVVFQEET